MFLERGHPAHDAIVIEVRHAPLDRLLNVGAAGVNNRSEMLQDRPGKRRRFFNIGVDPRIFFAHTAMIRFDRLRSIQIQRSAT